MYSEKFCLITGASNRAAAFFQCAYSDWKSFFWKLHNKSLTRASTKSFNRSSRRPPASLPVCQSAAVKFQTTFSIQSMSSKMNRQSQEEILPIISCSCCWRQKSAVSVSPRILADLYVAGFEPTTCLMSGN